MRKYRANKGRIDRPESMMINNIEQFKFILNKMYHLLTDFLGFVKGTF